MATASVARELPLQLVHYVRQSFAYNTKGVDTGLAISRPLPAGAVILNVGLYVTTGFNAGTTNDITVGTNSTDYNNLIASADFTAEETGGVLVKANASVKPLAADTAVYVKYLASGTAASAGAGTVVVSYIVDNDR